ncbi:MAG: serine/threonine-protein kinase RsbW [Halioglobus sp.]|jgi:serine/threonine-protein kinase RsbW
MEILKMSSKMLTISSNPNNILKVENYLRNAQHDMNIDETKFPDILISLTEAVNNAILHGNNADESKNVEISMEEIFSGVAISVKDEGNGFDPNEIPDPTAPENIECCGGRGVFIMSRLADKISFENNGSTVQLFFKLN